MLLVARIPRDGFVQVAPVVEGVARLMKTRFAWHHRNGCARHRGRVDGNPIDMAVNSTRKRGEEIPLQNGGAPAEVQLGAVNARSEQIACVQCDVGPMGEKCCTDSP